MSVDRSPIRMLVADDDETVLSFMLHVLGSAPDFQVVASAVNGRDAVRLASKTEPQVALLDWYMPLLNGLEAARQIMTLRSEIRVLIVSGYSEERWVLKALRAGVKGYLSKTALAKETISAVLRVAAGELYCDGLVDHRAAAAALREGPEKDALSPREREVLQLVAEGHSTRSIASILEISDKTVGHHRSAISEKLQVHDLPGLTRYAIREGIIRA